jgi:hypothetical protein
MTKGEGRGRQDREEKPKSTGPSRLRMNKSACATRHEARVTNYESRVTKHESRDVLAGAGYKPVNGSREEKKRSGF